MKELKMFIDGRFIEHESGKWIKVLNPSTEEVISLMPDGTVEDAKRAIDAAGSMGKDTFYRKGRLSDQNCSRYPQKRKGTD